MDYRYIIFDVDDTLLDYRRAESDALKKVLDACGISDGERLAEEFAAICLMEWSRYKMDETADSEVQQDYHKRYYEYSVKRFEVLKERISTAMTAEEMSRRYLDAFALERGVLPHVRQVLRMLARSHRLFVATNGLAFVQRSRLKRIQSYFSHIYISEEMGMIKPERAFFTRILNEQGIENAEECLMVGDSLTSDIAGAASAGMHTCWFNPNHKQASAQTVPDYEIADLRKLLDLLSAES